MIDLYVNDIEKSLENKAYFTALALALALPDICGNAEYPNETSVAKRYIGWYDTYISKYNAPVDNEPYLSGEIVYNLRNTFLHTGSPNIDRSKVKKETNQLDQFTLVLGNETKILSSSINIDTPLASIRIMSINVTYLCRNICECALWYYHKYSERFHFDLRAIDLEYFPTYTLSEEDLNADPLLQLLNNKIENSGSKMKFIKSENQNLTKSLIQNTVNAFCNSQPTQNASKEKTTSLSESTNQKEMSAKHNPKKISKRENQIRSFFGQYFKENKYKKEKEYIIQIVLNAKTKQQVNTSLMKKFSSSDTGVIYKRILPLIKELPGK